MSDMVTLSRTNRLNPHCEDAPRNDFDDGVLGIVYEDPGAVGIAQKRPFKQFRSWGRDHFATKTNLRPHGDAWRLRWWYHASIVFNHRAEVGKCDRASVHPVHGLLPLRVSRRWTSRSGERLDFYIRGLEPHGESQS